MVQLIDILAAGVTNESGIVLSGGSVQFYEAGTTTPKTVYSEFELETPLANPATLDAAGRLVAFCEGRARIVISSAAGAAIRTIDDIGISAPIVLSDIQAGLTTQINTALTSSQNLTNVFISTTPYTVTTANEIVFVDATAAAITVNLPSTADVSNGKQFWIKKIDSTVNAVTVDASDTQTIDGELTRALLLDNESIGIASDSSNWAIISETSVGDIDKRNYIINGGMDFFQRTTSNAGVVTSQHIADRFRWSVGNMDNLIVTLTRSTTIPTLAESGFQGTYSFKVDTTTVETAIADDESVTISYNMEGYDYAQLKGKAVTLSFWVRSTKTGIHCVSFKNNGSDRSYVAEYTVSLTDTWEKKTITLVINPTGGTDNFTNGTGLRISWCLISGSDFHTTANAWQTGNFIATASQVNSLDSTSNDFFLTQVQLTVGARSLPFKRSGESITGELILAQRYYEKSYDVDTALASVTNAGAHLFRSVVSHLEVIRYTVTKAGLPAVAFYNPATGAAATWRDTTASANRAAAIDASSSGHTGVACALTGTVAGNSVIGHWRADAELT